MKEEKEATNADDLAIQDPLNVAKEKSQGPLAIFINNPGLQHLAKEIFWNLSFEALENCQQLNQSSKRIIDDPFFARSLPHGSPQPRPAAAARLCPSR